MTTPTNSTFTPPNVSSTHTVTATPGFPHGADMTFGSVDITVNDVHVPVTLLSRRLQRW